MKTVFACTHVTKYATVDNFETGCEIERTCIMADPVNLTAPTMAGLIEKLNETYGLKIDNIFIPDSSEPVRYFGFNRMENGEGYEPSESEESAWKQGECPLWLADYSFSVEKRVVSDLTAEDLQGIDGITIDG